MIVSHKHKFIFIPIPKTGTHSIRFALRPQLGKNDWEQVELFRRSRVPMPSLAKISHGHITSLIAKKELGNRIWNSYFKFSIVRNPYDRFVSYSFFKKGKSSLFENRETAMMKLFMNDPSVKNDILFKPQLHFISNKQNELMVDYIGRFENLHQSFDTICKEIGINKVDLELVNTTKHKNYKHYYDKDLRKLVECFYKKEIDLFNYIF